MAVRLLATVFNWGPLCVTARPGASQTLKRDFAALVATDGEFLLLLDDLLKTSFWTKMPSLSLLMSRVG